MSRIILASASPRRRDLMGRMGLEFDVVASAAERAVSVSDPGKYALAQASFKAMDAAAAHPLNIIVAADTVVAISGHILGKPRDASDAQRMLSMLSGRTHTVYTALVVIDIERRHERISRADVTFADMSRYEIDTYINTGEPMDKAGAYGIQDIGMRYIKSVSGDFYAVVGLPVRDLYEIMKEIGEI